MYVITVRKGAQSIRLSLDSEKGKCHVFLGGGGGGGAKLGGGPML